MRFIRFHLLLIYTAYPPLGLLKVITEGGTNHSLLGSVVIMVEENSYTQNPVGKMRVGTYAPNLWGTTSHVTPTPLYTQVKHIYSGNCRARLDFTLYV